MKNIVYVSTIFVLFMVFNGCNENMDPILSQDIIVVQAYLYASEPVTDIRLTRTLPLDVDEEAEPEPVNDAEVRLIKNDQVYHLDPSPGDSGYYHYSGNDLSIGEGDLFRLEINYNNNLIFAETIVPEEPQQLSMSDQTVVIPDMRDIFLGNVDLNDLIVTVTWKNDDRSLYYATVENIEEDPIAIRNSDAANRQRIIRRRMVFRPSPSDEFRIGPMQFEYFGQHLVKIYHVNQEYADLYNTQDQDSRSLNEPLTNIHNGLGVFSAFHSNTDSLILTVK